MNDRQLYSLPETARKLTVSERTVMREIERGKLKAARVGRKYLISEEALAQYLGKRITSGSLDQKIHELCQTKKSEMITLLQKLVSIPSESETENVTLMARYLKEKLEEFKIRNFLHGEGEGVAVQGTYGYAEKGIMLDCPLDITPVGSLAKWMFPPYEGVIKNGRMIGRGTADCKGGIVAMIYAALVLRELVEESKIRVELVFDGGEQNGGYHGMRSVLEEGLSVDAGMIGYAGKQDDIQIGCRGYHRYILITHGQSVHTGARHQMGVNAINKMAKLITTIERTPLPTPQNPYFPFGSRTTFTLIDGGDAINMVPDKCEARLDIRTIPRQSRRQIQHFLTKVIKQIKRDDRDFNVTIQYEIGCDAYLLDEREEIIIALQHAIQNTLHKNPKLLVHGPAHTGALLYQHHTPVVVWGPKGGNVHTYNEFVEVESLPETVEIYVKTILNFFSISSQDSSRPSS